MKNKKLILIGFTLSILLVFSLATNIISNSWMLLTDNANYIPEESNLLFFNPTQIDDGSGGYWRYGEDLKNYYYFSTEKEKTYFLIEKNNDCVKFSKLDIRT